MRYKNIAGRFIGLVTKHACADRQNYDSQDCASIAASRSKNGRGNSICYVGGQLAKPGEYD